MTNESTIPTPATPDICTVAILIDGAEISGEFTILSVYVSREINRIPSATLVLQDGEASQATFKVSNSEHFIPGKAIEIQLGYRSQNDSVFKGIIVKHSIKLRRSGSQLIVECRDAAVKMTSGQRSRYYTDKKDSDILEEIIGAYGLQKNVAATGVDLKEIVQYQATDWDFIVLRAEANGLIVNVEDGNIMIGPPAILGQAVLTVKYGATLLELDAEIDARWQSKGIVAESWSAAEQAVVSVDAKEPEATDNGNLNAGDLAGILSDDPNKIRHGGLLTEPELQAWADGRLLQERLAKVRGRAKFQGFAGIKPDSIIDLGGVGERFEGRFYVSGVRHSFAKGNWETDVQLGVGTETFAESFDLKPMPAAGVIPAVGGLQIGVVTALENDPDGEDRIKVKLPLISQDDEGVWARLITLDAGKERGTFFRPDADDEVIVGFLNDDPRHPVILGMCHSSAKPAPEPAKDDNQRKGYVSREKIKLVFDDEKKSVTLETPGGNKLQLSDDDKGIVIEDQNGNKIALNGDGVHIESSKALTYTAASDVKIEGANIDLKAQSGFKAEASATAELSGVSTTLQGSAKTVIKGGIVQIN